MSGLKENGSCWTPPSHSQWNFSFSPNALKRPTAKRWNYKEIHDLTTLEEITFEKVLDCLIERYYLKEYYTFAGSMLISLNPCLKNSRRSLTKEDVTCQMRANEGTNLPHVFSIGKKCLSNLKTVGSNQVIIVTGNSGAGKTTATQQLLTYFIDESQSNMVSTTPNGLDKKINFATQILESLGNASTSSNPNSSRFGRFVQLNFRGASEHLVGAEIRTCLLEKHRVSKCSPLERNFHIFYYIFASLENGHFNIEDFIGDSELGMIWRTLIPLYFQEGLRSFDEEQFYRLHQSLKSINMATEFQAVFNIIFGIMILLHIQFVPWEDHMQSFRCNNESSLQLQREFTVEDTSAVEALSDVFGVDGQRLIDVLVVRKIKAGGGGSRLRRESIFWKPCQSVQECQERTAALTSHLYDAVFHHVLGLLNTMIASTSYQMPNTRTDSAKDYTRTVSLLDLYGFENLEDNHLEQLCINYANERLQKVHITRMKSHFNEMANWEMDFKDLELDNVIQEFSDRIEILQNGIFKVLNEECLLNRNNSESQVLDRLRLTAMNTKYMTLGKTHDPVCPFIVKHYAMDVKYQLTGMIIKNSDNIPPEFNELFESSSKLFLKSLIANLTNLESGRQRTETDERLLSESIPTADLTLTPRSRETDLNRRIKAKRGKTILQRFKVSVDELMSELGTEESQDLHFIRCIRPNNELAEGKVQPEIVRKQLFASGLVDIIRITGNGFPIRISKSKFYSHFPIVMKRIFRLGQAELDFMFPNAFNFAETDMKFGKTQVFLTENTWAFLLKVENFIYRKSAIKLQRSWQAYQTRKREAVLQENRVTQVIEELDQFHITSLNGSLLQDENSNSFEIGQGDHQEKVETVVDPVQNHHQRERISFEKAIIQHTSLMTSLNLRSGERIVTRGRIYKGLIRVYTTKPTLPFVHVVPIRLKSNGLNEALPNMYENLFSNS